MKRQVIFIMILLMVTFCSFANGITGVWEQNPWRQESKSDNKAVMYNLSRGNDKAIVFWQFTEDGHFVYEESNCGCLYNALRGHYSLLGSSLTLVVDEVVFHNADPDAGESEPADSFEAGTTATISVTATDNELTLSNNPFVEVGTLTLKRISNCTTFSPANVMPGTWSLFFMDCSGDLDSDESNATRLKPDHTFFYVWECGDEHIAASGPWNITDDKFNMIFENSDNQEQFPSGLSHTYAILICCPERLSCYSYREESVFVFIPSDGSLIDKYFGGVSSVDADQSPRITTTGDSLLIENAENATVSVFDLDGRTLVNQQSYDGKPITLPAGQYLVKVNDSVFKISH